MSTRKRVESWVVTDEIWQRVEPLIPVRQRSADKSYVRKAGAAGQVVSQHNTLLKTVDFSAFTTQPAQP